MSKAKELVPQLNAVIRLGLRDATTVGDGKLMASAADSITAYIDAAFDVKGAAAFLVLLDTGRTDLWDEEANRVFTSELAWLTTCEDDVAEVADWCQAEQGSYSRKYLSVDGHVTCLALVKPTSRHERPERDLKRIHHAAHVYFTWSLDGEALPLIQAFAKFKGSKQWSTGMTYRGWLERRRSK